MRIGRGTVVRLTLVLSVQVQCAPSVVNPSYDDLHSRSHQQHESERHDPIVPPKGDGLDVGIACQLPRAFER